MPSREPQRGRLPTMLRGATLPDDNGMTLEQVAAELGVTRERVRQIEGVALRKFLQALNDRGFDADDFFD